MRLRTKVDRIPGWLRLIEDADPSASIESGYPIGVMDEATNFCRTEAGRYEVRGGSLDKLSLVDAVPNPMTSVITGERYSQTGVAIVAHRSTSSRHYAFLYDGGLTALSQRVDLGWNIATPAKARIVELFEELFIIDATAGTPASRQAMKYVTSAGAVGTVQGDLGAGLEDLSPLAHEVWNNVLFMAGQDSLRASSPAMLRHSFLGRSPRAANGWNKDAYAIIGSKGDPINALSAGHFLLIAKGHELYRLSGFGRALEGWQYAVQPLDNTDGIGVEWPGALCYVEGRWFGVGYGGPFVTDGEEIVSLVGPRRRSWRAVSGLDRAICRFHPERRVVLFGLCTASATRPNTFWQFAVDSNEWVGDLVPPVGANDAFSIPATVAQGPAAAPGVITVTHASATETATQGTLVLGDATAYTRVWVDKGAGFVLETTLAPGVNAWSVAGLTKGTKYPVKMDHLKNGIASAFNAEADSFTLLEIPSIIAAGDSAPNKVYLEVTVTVAGVTITWRRDGVDTAIVISPMPVGTEVRYDTGATCGVTHSYVARASRPDWPAAIQTRDSAADGALACTVEPH